METFPDLKLDKKFGNYLFRYFNVRDDIPPNLLMSGAFSLKTAFIRLLVIAYPSVVVFQQNSQNDLLKAVVSL